MGIRYLPTNKAVPEFFWPHCDESRYVINWTWQLLLEALTDQAKYMAVISRREEMTEGQKTLFNMVRGRIHAYLKVLSRFDGNYCGEADKILIEANNAFSEMVRANFESETES